MQIEFKRLTWGPKDWYWCVTLGHVSAAGRDQDPIKAAEKLVSGIQWVQARFAEPRTSERTYCFEPEGRGND